MMNTNMFLQVLLVLLAVATFLGSTECKVIITEVGANSDINVRRRLVRDFLLFCTSSQFWRAHIHF